MPIERHKQAQKEEKNKKEKKYTGAWKNAAANVAAGPRSDTATHQQLLLFLTKHLQGDTFCVPAPMNDKFTIKDSTAWK
jgi:hypothetical protein